MRIEHFLLFVVVVGMGLNLYGEMQKRKIRQQIIYAWWGIGLCMAGIIGLGVTAVFKIGG